MNADCGKIAKISDWFPAGPLKVLRRKIHKLFSALIMAKKILKDYTNISLKLKTPAQRLNFKDIFGRTADVNVEIGSGKGTFLLSQAKLHPQSDFLGIEWANKYYRFAVDRIGRWGLTNVRIIRTDAAAFLAQNLHSESIDCFHIYFPDPWPKKRHHKRRFICKPNILQMIRCLKKAGRINIATDHAEYFEQITDTIQACIDAKIAEHSEFLSPAGAEQNELVGTNYERKYIKDKRKIYTTAIRKTY